jgi:hypothetical protein
MASTDMSASRQFQLRSYVLQVKGFNDFGATTSDNGGFICTEDVWAETYLLSWWMMENKQKGFGSAVSVVILFSTD